MLYAVKASLPDGFVIGNQVALLLVSITKTFPQDSELRPGKAPVMRWDALSKSRSVANIKAGFAAKNTVNKRLHSPILSGYFVKSKEK
jgi:hypothetical protein